SAEGVHRPGRFRGQPRVVQTLLHRAPPFKETWVTASSGLVGGQQCGLPGFETLPSERTIGPDVNKDERGGDLVTSPRIFAEKARNSRARGQPSANGGGPGRRRK